jgi:hypothetical protein
MCPVDGGGIAKHPRMAQLIELVGPDGARGKPLQIPRHVGRRSGKQSEPRLGIGDFRRRGEDQRAIRMAGTRTSVHEVDKVIERFGQGVHRIGVVPEHAEVVGRGRHACEAFHGFRRVGFAGRV